MNNKLLKYVSFFFYYCDRYHSSLIRIARWVAVASLIIAVFAVVVENNFDVDSQRVGLIRENYVGPVFLISVGTLFLLWVRRNMKQG